MKRQILYIKTKINLIYPAWILEIGAVIIKLETKLIVKTRLLTLEKLHVEIYTLMISRTPCGLATRMNGKL